MDKQSSSGHELVILGAGGFAREIAWLVSQINRDDPGHWNVVGFWSHDPSEIGSVINGLPVIDRQQIVEQSESLFAVAAIGAPRIRERAVNDAVRVGLRFATLVHPSVLFDEATVTIGEGSIICAGSILTTNITIGAHVIVNLDCTIGHDCVLEDFVTLSPGCHLSGHTTARRGSYLGTGMITVERHEIGKCATIGAQAAVVKDIPPGVIATGVPAKPRVPS